MPPRPRLLTPAQALERERKLLARKERNRASAALHRERKNQTIDTLTQRVDELLTENRRLKALASENRELRAALAELKKSKESIATLSPLNPSPQLSTKSVNAVVASVLLSGATVSMQCMCELKLIHQSHRC